MLVAPAHLLAGLRAERVVGLALVHRDARERVPNLHERRQNLVEALVGAGDVAALGDQTVGGP